MTHDDDTARVPAEPLAPDDEARVSHALGALPRVGPTPEAVVARLDARLAELAAERPGGLAPDALRGRHPAASALGGPRRRGGWRTGLVAAATVAVVGVGLGTVWDDLSLRGGDEAISESTAGGAAREQTLDAPADEGGTAADDERAETPPGVLLATSPQELSRVGLARDVRRLMRLAGPARVPAPADPDDDTGSDPGTDPGTDGPSVLSAAPDALAPCATPALRPGDRVAPVVLDGQRATLVLRRSEEGRHDARIYACGEADVLLARVVVRAR